MSTFNEADHPRADTGQFTDKTRKEVDVDLATTFTVPARDLLISQILTLDQITSATVTFAAEDHHYPQPNQCFKIDAHTSTDVDVSVTGVMFEDGYCRDVNVAAWFPVPATVTATCGWDTNSVGLHLGDRNPATSDMAGPVDEVIQMARVQRDLDSQINDPQRLTLVHHQPKRSPFDIVETTVQRMYPPTVVVRDRRTSAGKAATFTFAPDGRVFRVEIYTEWGTIDASSPDSLATVAHSAGRELKASLDQGWDGGQGYLEATLGRIVSRHQP